MKEFPSQPHERALDDSYTRESFLEQEDNNLEENISGSEKKSQLEKIYSEFGVIYPDSLEEAEIKTRHIGLRYLQEEGLISAVNGELVVDKEKILKYSESNTFRKIIGGKKLSRSMFIEMLSGQTVLTKEDPASPNDPEDRESKILFPVAKNLEDISNFGHVSENALLNVWEFGRPNWGAEIDLEEGNSTNLAELYIANLLNTLNARRRNDVLEIIDPETGKYRKFSTNHLMSSGIKLPTINGENGKKYTFGRSPSLFAEKALQNLISLDILRFSDFERGGSTEAEDLYGSRRVVLTGKKYIGFTNEEGDSVRYYFSHSLLEVNEEEKVELQKIDRGHIGVFIDGELSKVVQLLDSGRIADLRSEMSKKRPDIEESKLTPYISIGAEEMSSLIKEYDTTEYLPPRETESTVSYAKRISRFSNYDKVVGSESFQGFLADTGFRAIKLPWREQLILAEVLQQIPKEKMKKFAIQYGEDGVRTFLSAETDEGMVDKIFALEERLGESTLKNLFRTYTHVIDSGSNAEEILDTAIDPSTPEEERTNVRRKVVERMSDRAKELILTFSNTSQGANPEDIETLSKTLEQINGNITLYASVFKTLSETTGPITPETLFENSIEEIRVGDMSPEEKNEMLQINSAARQEDYSPELLLESQKDLETSFDTEDPNTVFYILRYKDIIVAYIRIEVLENGHYYAGSLNVTDEAKSSHIGHTLLSKVIDLKATMAPVEAVALPTIPIYPLYLTRYGFQEAGTIKDYKGTGVDVMKLIRPKEESSLEHPDTLQEE